VEQRLIQGTSFSGGTARGFTPRALGDSEEVDPYGRKARSVWPNDEIDAAVDARAELRSDVPSAACLRRG
jgi:hypothetical protein